MRWVVGLAGIVGVTGVIGATLYAHVRPIPALGQAAYMALFHAAPLLFLSREKPAFLPRLQVILFFAGILLFTGSIYLKYLAGWEAATTIAPAGGTLLIIGWILFLIGAVRR